MPIGIAFQLEMQTDNAMQPECCAFHMQQQQQLRLFIHVEKTQLEHVLAAEVAIAS